jgi:acetyltransferase-like isoleucine patch superfamily enzyme
VAGDPVVIRGVRNRARRLRRALAGRDEAIQAARPGAIVVGHATYLAAGCLVKTWAPTERIEIGAYTSIAEEVRILHPGVNETLTDRAGGQRTFRFRGNHRPDTATTFPIGILVPDMPFDEAPSDGSWESNPLVVGSDVWLGYRSLISGPVTVGHGAIVAAGAVVLRDIPPYAIAAGNPAQVIRYRFSPDIVAAMLRIAWWTWPPDRVAAEAAAFLEPVATFVGRFDPGPPEPPTGSTG